MHGWENLRDADRDTILAGVEAGRALGGPFHVEIDPVDVCNADCFFCSTVELRKGDILPWETLEPVVDRLIAGGLRSFRMSGGGESTLYPHFGELCEKMAEADVALDMLTTNGIRMNDELIDHLLKLNRITHVFFSLNYATAPHYQDYMRTPANRFDWVVENIRRLDRRLREEGRREHTLIHTQFFIHRSTVEDIPEAMRLALELPVDSVTIRSVGLIPENEILRAEDIDRIRELLPVAAGMARGKRWLELEFGPEGLKEFCQTLLREARAPQRGDGSDGEKPHRILDGLGHDDLESPGLHAGPSPIEYCYIGWYSTVIMGNGDIHPCCFIMTDQAIPAFGNLQRTSFDEIWHGERYQRHRTEMRTAMLLQERTPGQRRRFHCTQAGCWEHRTCPLSYLMADRDFYLAAHERLERLRQRPLMQLARMGNALSRRVIDSGRKLVGNSG